MMTRIRKPDGKAVFVLAVLLTLAGLGLCGILTVVVGKLNAAAEDGNRRVAVSFAEAYPFETDAAGTEPEYEDQPDAAAAPGLADSLSNKVLELTDKVNQYCAQKSMAAPVFFDIFGATGRVIGREMIDDDERAVFRMKNGYLRYGFMYTETPETYADIADFAEWADSRQTKFLVIITANKADDAMAAFPAGVPHGYADKEEEFVRFLDAHGIDCLNAKQALLDRDGDFFSWFYKTDHHWNVNAGMAIADEITQYLSRDCGLPADTDICDASGFERVTYPSLFLGTQGRRATGAYAAPEDFDILYPRFDTAFHISIPSVQLDKTGSFADTLIGEKAVHGRNAYLINPYVAFLHGDEPLTRITNLNCDNGIRVLVVKESQADVVNVYLACAVQYLDVIDPRHFDGSIRSFIEQTNPDLVIACSCPPVAGDEDMWRLR